MPTASKAIESRNNWQFTSDGAWDEGNHVSVTDKLRGLEIRFLKLKDSDSDCVVIPVDQVPSLIRTLIRFSTTGSISIASESVNS